LMFLFIIVIFQKNSVANFGVMMFTTIAIPLTRAIFSIILIEARPDLLLLTFYSILYMSLLLPTKLYAIMTIQDRSWTTTVRKQGQTHQKKYFDGLFSVIAIWNVCVVIGFSLKFVN
jgi:hypothetical protein